MKHIKRSLLPLETTGMIEILQPTHLQYSDISIREDSWIAKIAAKKLQATAAAIVIGRTIHLHHVSRHEFLQNKRWLKHEICHLKQFEQYGFVRFIAKYIWESIKKGYYRNKFEMAAREAEHL